MPLEPYVLRLLFVVFRAWVAWRGLAQGQLVGRHSVTYYFMKRTERVDQRLVSDARDNHDDVYLRNVSPVRSKLCIGIKVSSSHPRPRANNLFMTQRPILSGTQLYALEQRIQDVVVVELNKFLDLRKVGGQGLRMIFAIEFLVHWGKQSYVPEII